MMKKLMVFIVTLLIFVGKVQATESGSGLIRQVDLREGVVVINGFQYRIQKKRTKLFSGEHQLRLNLLKPGIRVNFVVDDEGVITKIRMKTPYVFRS